MDDSLHQVEGLEVAYCARIGEVDVRLVGSEVDVYKRQQKRCGSMEGNSALWHRNGFIRN